MLPLKSIHSYEIRPGQFIVWGQNPPQPMLVIATVATKDSTGVLLCSPPGKMQPRMIRPSLCSWSSGSFRLLIDQVPQEGDGIEETETVQ